MARSWPTRRGRRPPTAPLRGENGPVSLYRDEGVVLRTQKLGEADRIVTVLTREPRAGARGRQGRAAHLVEVRVASRAVQSHRRAVPHRSVARHRDAGRVAGRLRRGHRVDYARYTAGTAMLETAERLTDVEKEPAVQQYLLLVGGLRALAAGEHAARCRARRLPAAVAWPSPATRPASTTAPGAEPPVRTDGCRWRPVDRSAATTGQPGSVTVSAEALERPVGAC